MLMTSEMGCMLAEEDGRKGMIRHPAGEYRCPVPRCE
jgi:hypothetical protein